MRQTTTRIMRNKEKGLMLFNASFSDKDKEEYLRVRAIEIARYLNLTHLINFYWVSFL
jgi:hypothetical protein